MQPHQINVQFVSPVWLAVRRRGRRMTATDYIELNTAGRIAFHGARQRVALYLDMRQDESYTPNKLMLRTGSTFHDLTDGPVVELVEPSGWCVIPVANSRGEYVSIAIGEYTRRYTNPARLAPFFDRTSDPSTPTCCRSPF